MERGQDEFQFAWVGAEHPDGPWAHLRVLSLRGNEAISEPYSFELEVVHDGRGVEVDVDDLVGTHAAVRMWTRSTPTCRIIHGIVVSAVEHDLEEHEEGSRYRIQLAPPWTRSALMRKSVIYLEKTLRQIIDQVLQRTKLGAGLEPSNTPRPLGAREGETSYGRPRLTYTWAVEDVSRIDDVSARPYVVQYQESDVAFVSRLLEEEGISYHFEHADDECLLVLTDFDGGRIDRSTEPSFGANILGREVFQLQVGGRLRAKSVHLDDYNWEHPELELASVSPAGVTDFTDATFPGRFQAAPSHGGTLARVREERLDSERRYATALGHARLLSAGTLFRFDHSKPRLAGTYLACRVRHQAVQHNMADGDPTETYRQDLELARCGKGDSVGASKYRPLRRTPMPRIYGTQTAVVTTDPADRDAEIHVGGPHDLGCVRVRFHWDMDSGRHEVEPTSCWVRVSQFFAGRDHGALWHPRVGDEVVVEYIDGDPDRPIVTGRVYNGTHPAPENATNRPTFSAIKSNSSPYDGNYNMIAFEDLQGNEEIIIHAARDWNTNVKRSCSRAVGLHDKIHVEGDQEIIIDGSQMVTIGVDQVTNVTGHIVCSAGASLTCKSPLISLEADNKFHALGGAVAMVQSNAFAKLTAPITQVSGVQVVIDGTSSVSISGSVLTASGDIVTVKGGTVIVQGSTVNVTGDSAVNVSGGTVEVIGDGDVKVTGAVVALN